MRAVADEPTGIGLPPVLRDAAEAASGAAPVVRHWPFFAGRFAGGGARSLFPADWVVNTADQAAARIRALTADEATWRRAGADASRHVTASWDWDVVGGWLDGLLLGGSTS